MTHTWSDVVRQIYESMYSEARTSPSTSTENVVSVGDTRRSVTTESNTRADLAVKATDDEKALPSFETRNDDAGPGATQDMDRVLTKAAGTMAASNWTRRRALHEVRAVNE